MIAQFKHKGFIPFIWDFDSTRDQTFKIKPFLQKLRLPVIGLHCWPSRAKDAIKLIHDDLKAEIVFGVGVDSIAREVAKGLKTVAAGIKTFVEIADDAVKAGAIAIMWNAEGDWKTPPNSTQRGKLVALIRGALSAVAAKYPKLVQLHTSFDHPHYHSTYPWEAWLGKGSPIAMSAPQVYAAPEGGLMAHRGALPAREARALSSWSEFVRKGTIRPDAPEGTPEDLEDCDWAPYYQLHHVTTRDTVTSALARMQSGPVFGWALKTRCDEQGETAVRILAILQRLGFTGPDAIRRWQSKYNLDVDGILGNDTTASILSMEGA